MTPQVAIAADTPHMDTALEASGKDVKPQVHANYQGGDIVINAEQNLRLNAGNAPQLARARGHDIITASGNTLLGADDKTGVAIIMTMVQYLYDHPEMQHGTIKIAFTPDEETGAGVEKFDVALGTLLEQLHEDDLVLVTADHGNDPTYKGTDHTREMVPLLAYSPSMKGTGVLPDAKTFAVIGATIAENFGVSMPEGTIGSSLLDELK